MGHYSTISPHTNGHKLLGDVRKLAYRNLCRNEIPVMNEGRYYQLFSKEYGDIIPVAASVNEEELHQIANRIRNILWYNGNRNVRFAISEYSGLDVVKTESVDMSEFKREYDLDMTGLGVTKYENGDLFAYRVIENGYNWIKVRKQDVKFISEDSLEYSIHKQRYEYIDNPGNETKTLTYGNKKVSWSYTGIKGFMDEEETDTFYVVGVMHEFYSQMYSSVCDIIDEYR